jgi:hypothetical protein
MVFFPEAVPAPGTVARRSTSRRPTNAALRTREHLAQQELENFIEGVKRNRHGRRDALP